MCPLVKAKTNSISSRTHVLACKPVWNIKTTIHTKRSWTRSIVRQCVHDKPPDASDDWLLALRCRPPCESTWSMHNILWSTLHALRHGCGRYFHIARIDHQHTILPIAKSEWRTSLCLCRCHSDVLLWSCCSSHLTVIARYIDWRHHCCCRCSRSRLPTSLRYKLRLIISYNFILRPLLSCHPNEYDLFVANYVVTNIYQPRLTIIL